MSSVIKLGATNVLDEKSESVKVSEKIKFLNLSLGSRVIFKAIFY